MSAYPPVGEPLAVRIRENLKEDNHKRESAKLLTVGSLIKYNGRVYEIERFTTDDDNQTIAHFGDETWEYLIPVEELEAVTE